MIRRVLCLLLLALAILFVPPTIHRAAGQSDVTVLYLSPLSTSSDTFTINVNLNLSSTEAITGYEILLYYDVSVLKAQSIQLGNVLPPGQFAETVNCIEGGVGFPEKSPGNTGCGIQDGPGSAHSAGVGGNVTGVSAGTLFSVQFNRVGNGTSLLRLSRDTATRETLINLGQGYINPHPILHVTYDGVFSNRGVAALFNLATAIPVVNQPVPFDARGSLTNVTGTITGYQWNFGDGTPVASGGPTISHTYNATGNHDATLVATDSNGRKGNITKTVAVVPALGGIQLYIFDLKGNDILSNITATLSNGTTIVTTQIKTAIDKGVVFSGLKPGTYRVDVAGGRVISSSKQETVITGWTTWDVAYLSLKPQPTVVDWSSIIFVTTLAAGFFVGALVIFLGRRRRRRMTKRPAS
jgi:hypothetical protein